MGLAAQAEASAKDASAFKDVAEGSKFEGAINLACSKGIVNGVSKDSFARVSEEPVSFAKAVAERLNTRISAIIRDVAFLDNLFIQILLRSILCGINAPLCRHNSEGKQK